MKNRVPKDFFINLLLFTIFFTFYYIFSTVVIPQAVSKTNESLGMIQAGFSFAIAITILAASQIIKKFELKHVIISLTTMIIAMLFTFFSNSYMFVISLIFVVGVFFSIGQLASYTYFWNTTKSEERGRIGGLIGFVSLPFFFIANYGLASGLDFFGNIILCVCLCFFGTLIISITKFRVKDNFRRTEIGYFPEKRAILLYSIPWIIFSLLNATLAKNISVSTAELIPSSFYLILISLQTVSALIGALSGGFIADYFGRRLTLGLSVTLYGISVIFRGFITSDLSFFFAFIAEGLSWGILLTLYSFVVWGDLSNTKNCAKMYSIGLIAFYLAAAIGQIPNFITEISLLNSALISCLMIFLSNIPIALAPELLSSDILEKMRMKKYMKTLRKIAEETDD